MELGWFRDNIETVYPHEEEYGEIGRMLEEDCDQIVYKVRYTSKGEFILKLIYEGEDESVHGVEKIRLEGPSPSIICNSRFKGESRDEVIDQFSDEITLFPQSIEF